jgi:hypothetical protein
MKRLGMVFLLSVLVVGCQDRRSATGPDSTAQPGGFEAAISDGAHSVGGKVGNPDFFFLPPLQPSPKRSANFDRSKFNPSLLPVVKICIGRNSTPAGECADALTKNGQPVVFNAVRGWDGLPDWVDPEQYHVLWRTRDYNLVPGNYYRILVKVGGTLLGYLDIGIVPSNQPLRALKITAGGQDVGWLDDWVVPIRFRIEQGALSNLSGGRVGTEFTVPASGGSVTLTHLDTALAAVYVPAGALQNPSDQVTIVIAQEPPRYDGNSRCVFATDLVQADWCYTIRTLPDSAYHFASDVRVEICVDPTPVVAAEEDPDKLRVFKSNQADPLVELPWAEPTLIGEGCLGPPAPVPGAPGSSAQGILRRLGNWASRLFTPSDLMASVFATPPKGLGGSTTTFSDFGGAVPPEGGIVVWSNTSLIYNGSAAFRSYLTDGEDTGGDTDDYFLLRNILVHLTGKNIGMRILYTDGCDPREDEGLCDLSESFDYLQPFFDTLDSIGTITFANMSTVDLADYDVVIANFCSALGNPEPNPERTALLAYLAAGRPAVVLGDNFCYYGDSPSAAAAALVVMFYGDTITGAETYETDRLLVPEGFQIGLLAGVTNLNQYRYAPQIIRFSFKPVVWRPWTGAEYPGPTVLIAIREPTEAPVPSPSSLGRPAAPAASRVRAAHLAPAALAPGETSATRLLSRRRLLVPRH